MAMEYEPLAVLLSPTATESITVAEEFDPIEIASVPDASAQTPNAVDLAPELDALRPIAIEAWPLEFA